MKKKPNLYRTQAANSNNIFGNQAFYVVQSQDIAETRMLSRWPQGNRKSSYSETRPLWFCGSRGLCRCRRAPQPVAYDSTGAQLRSLRQCPWRLWAWRCAQCKVNMLCLESQLPYSHTEIQGHTTRSPSESSFNFGLIHNGRMFRNLLLWSNPSGAPHVGLDAVWGENSGCHTWTKLLTGTTLSHTAALGIRTCLGDGNFLLLMIFCFA